MDVSKRTRDKARLLFPELLGSAPTVEERQDAKASVKQARDTYGDEFDIRALMAGAKDPLTNKLRDLKVDDRDLELAKNYYDWCFRVSGSTTYPWIRQAWVVLHSHGEICPRCSDRKWFNDPLEIPKGLECEAITEKLQLLEYGVCPKCGSRKSELVRANEMKLYDEYVLCWGQRSGKSRTAASDSGYHTHRMLKFPQFGTLSRDMDVATPLTCSFVSLTFSKAFALLWEPFTKMLLSSPWYQELFKVLDHYGNRYGQELYRLRKEYITFDHKNLVLKPTHPSWDQLRGETRFRGIIDELGLFPAPPNLFKIIAESHKDEELANQEDEEEEEDDGNEEGEDESKRQNADEAHKSLDNSLLTIRTVSEHLLMKEGMDAVPTGMLAGVSSPTSYYDKVMRLIREAQTPEGSAHILASQLPTWEVNPSISRDSRAIVNAYARNKVKAERDFGANPPTGSSSYIPIATVKNGIFEGPPNTHKLMYMHSGDKVWANLVKVHDNWKKSATLMTTDAGYSDNSFAVTVWSFDELTGKAHNICALELIPTKGRKIDFNKMYTNVILPLAKDLHSYVLLSDRWNSIDHHHRFMADRPKSKSKLFTLKRRHFDSMVKMMERKSYVCPRPELKLSELFEQEVTNYRTMFMNKPAAHLAFQMATVRDLGPTRAPEKAPGLTDDLFRAWSLGAMSIFNESVQRTLSKIVLPIANDDVDYSIAVSLGRSGRGWSYGGI